MPNQDFPRSKRMLSSEEYDQVFKKPARAGSRGLLILARMNDCSTPRLGLVVPKKVLKRAVWRNRVKRLVRESFRLSQDSLPNADLVFLAKPGIRDISDRDLTSTLNRLWAQISRQLNKQRSS
ncbi:MAG TPA: ribonuclease P protein component [Candidatus Anaerobiospirillum pullistercoris]|uniref:Ribonuclease P protein component n=1 Tax=Candidatus Anaerobiospirillum pullistercoris TaxID=2838452 RepID=A0A9D1WEF2_9GAMM|nr:ribonuclease P protein component [Candidatus Anaerobiospirillum pullistercoris]